VTGPDEVRDLAPAPYWDRVDIEAFTAELDKCMREGKPKLLTPLPRRVRLRLALTRAVDSAAIWLADRRRFGAAERLWRVTGLWRG
jgi:hypothetical protein